MKKLLSLSAALMLLTLSSSSPSSVLPIGSEMPEANRKMKDISGKEISLTDAVGANGLLVMFSCNTCPYVIKNQERTIEICQFARKQNIGVVLINSNEAYRNGEDSYKEMQSYAESQKYQWHYVVDNDATVANAFGASRTPETFLFNKERKLVYHGAIDDNPADAKAVTRQHLKEAINELIAGKDISQKETKSVGCTIKRLKKEM